MNYPKTHWTRKNTTVKFAIKVDSQKIEERTTFVNKYFDDDFHSSITADFRVINFNKHCILRDLLQTQWLMF